jgi:hypothetical protein
MEFYPTVSVKENITQIRDEPKTISRILRASISGKASSITKMNPPGMTMALLLKKSLSASPRHPRIKNSFFCEGSIEKRGTIRQGKGKTKTRQARQEPHLS